MTRFDHVLSRRVKCDARPLSKPEYAEWMAGKPISTFHLIPDEEFQAGLERFIASDAEDTPLEFFVYHTCVYVTGVRS